MPVENIAEFILYITPGFIAIEIYRRHFPAKERNTFTQVTQSIIFALIIIALLRIIDGKYLNNWLHTNKGLTLDTRFTIVLILSGIVFGYLAVYQLKIRSHLYKRYEKLSWLASEPDSIWQQIILSNNEDWSVVYLDDGSIYLGWISNYQADPNKKDQDFLLSDAKCINDELSEKYQINGQGVYWNTRDIKSIEFIKGI